jgi:hypothetical protein
MATFQEDHPPDVILPQHDEYLNQVCSEPPRS